MEDENSINIFELIDGGEDDSIFGSKEKISKRQGGKKLASITSKPPKRKRKPKPPDMPRRPLSAYNIFFQEQRALIIGTNPPCLERRQTNATTSNFERKKRAHRRTHGKISFSDLAKAIGKKWNELSEDGRSKYVESASKEKARYQEELKVYRSKRQELNNTQNQTNKTKRASSHQSQDTPISTPSSKRYRSQETYHPAYKRSPDHVLYFRYPNEICFRDDRFCDLESNIMSRCGTFDLEENSIRESRDEILDDIQPLPIGYDPSIHQGEFISNHEMAKLVAPLLKGSTKTQNSPTRIIHNYSQDDLSRQLHIASTNTRNLAHARTVPSTSHNRIHDAQYESPDVNPWNMSHEFHATHPYEYSSSRSFDYSTHCRDTFFSL
jgi:hypothetical protein